MRFGILIGLLYFCSFPHEKQSDLISIDSKVNADTTIIDSLKMTSWKDTTTKLFFISNFEKYFKYKQVKSFKRESVENEIYIDYGKILGTTIDTSDYPAIFQNSGIYLSSYLYQPVFYSIQQTKGYQGITVIGMDNDYVIKVCMFTYNLKGRLIGKAFLYENGGDAGYWTDGWGTFLNDSTYLKTRLDCGPNNNDKYKYYCDSTTSLIHINYTGLINIEQLSNERKYKND